MHGDRDGVGAQLVCERLRKLIPDCVSKHMNKSAIFYAGKLCCMSNNNHHDVYLLAQAYYVNKEFRRALSVLNKQELFDKDVRFRYLAALCLAECSDWEECLVVIGAEDTPELLKCKERSTDSQGVAVSMYSAVCLLRGRVYDALENRTRAIQWYKQALSADPFCYDAYEALMQNHMLTSAQERSAIASLSVHPEDQWLTFLYTAMCKKYERQDEIERNLDILEGRDPDGTLGKVPLQPSGKQNAAPAVVPMSAAVTAVGGDEDKLSVASVVAAVSSDGSAGGAAVPAAAVSFEGLPRDTDGRVSEENDPLGAAAMDMGPSDPDAAVAVHERRQRDTAMAIAGRLASDVSVYAARAELLLTRGDALAAYRLCTTVMRRDPLCTECMDAYLACLVELGKKNDLFQLGHRLVRDYPDNGIAWHAVGCYYYATAQYDAARRFFGKATQLAPRHAPAWIAYGHAFAAQDESDQALAAYRTAARLFPGLHQPVLGMGREYQHMNNPMLAEQMYLQANSICNLDPLVCNELGVLFYQERDYESAVAWLRRALDLLTADRISPSWQPTVVNLGHVYRKQGLFDDAVRTYLQALGLMPNDPGTLAALAFTYHMMGKLAAAIEMYHKALAFKSDCSFTAALLPRALKEHCEFCCRNDDPGLM